MLMIAIGIALSLTAFIGFIAGLFICERLDRKSVKLEREEKIDFSTTYLTEETLVQHALISYYEQQREELIARQKIVGNTTIVNMKGEENDDSGYRSAPSSTNTPHSLYECTGFASMENLAVNNPLFANDLLEDQPRISISSPTID